MKQKKSRHLAEWTRLLDAPKSLPGDISGSTVKVRLGNWQVNLIGIADEIEPGIEVDCPVDLLALHAELVVLFGAVQEKFGELIKNANSGNGIN